MESHTDFPDNKAYQRLDLNAGSVAEAALMEAVDREASRSRITLTADGASGSLTGGITSEMNAWLGGYVSPFRQSALAELESAARLVTIGKKTDGVLLEIEEDKLERDRVKRRSAIYSEFHDDFGDMLDRRDQLDDEYQDIRVRENNRDAQVPSALLEWGVLFPLVLIPEGLLNFESFRRAPIISSDFMALGATLLVGLGIAVAAHLVGAFVKQFAYYMRHDDEDQRGKGYRRLSLGSALLTMSLAAVGTARYYYLLPLREQAIILGQTPPNILTQTGSLLVGNVVVFLVAAAFTYLLHDSNPVFSDKKRKLDLLDQQIDQLKKKRISGPLSEIDKALKQKIDLVRSIEQQMNGKSGYRELREEFSKFRAQDQRVAALLVKYRTRLCGEVQARDNEVIFDRLYISADRGGGRQQISAADFEALPLKLYTC